MARTQGPLWLFPLTIGLVLLTLGLGLPAFEALQFRMSQDRRPVLERPEAWQPPPPAPPPIPWRELAGAYWETAAAGAALVIVTLLALLCPPSRRSQTFVTRAAFACIVLVIGSLLELRRSPDAQAPLIVLTAASVLLTTLTVILLAWHEP